MITIYHNETCSKSLGALQLLHDRSIPFAIRNYIEQPLTKGELKALLTKLRLNPLQLVRQNEPLLTTLPSLPDNEEEWLDLMIANPVLIERPIVENEQSAIVARPPERVLEII